MRVLGLDPGYERLGVAILEALPNGKHQVIFSACWRTSSQMTFSERLLNLGIQLEALIAEYAPKFLAIEKLYFETNQKTAMHVSEARGMMLYVAARAGLTAHEYTPLEIKVAVTGYGKATKAQIIKMVPLLSSLPHKPKYDDEYDAIAVGLTFMARDGR